MQDRQAKDAKQAWRAAAAVCGGALWLMCVAAMNRYPLLYPDSVQYVSDGHSVWHGLLYGGTLRSV